MDTLRYAAEPRNVVPIIAANLYFLKVEGNVNEMSRCSAAEPILHFGSESGVLTMIIMMINGYSLTQGNVIAFRGPAECCAEYWVGRRNGSLLSN
jgi:hypothetical protein